MSSGGPQKQKPRKRAIVAADKLDELHEDVIPDPHPIDTKGLLRARPLTFPDQKIKAVEPRGVEYRGKFHDIGFTVFEPQQKGGHTAPNDIAVFSNGAGLAQLTADELVDAGASVSSMLDLKMHFSAQKILDGLAMSYKVNPHIKAVAMNVYSGTLNCSNLVEAIKRFNRMTRKSVPLVVRMRGPNHKDGMAALERLAEKNPHISLADSTEELLKKTLDATYGTGTKSLPQLSADQLRAKIRQAYTLRRESGVSVDPDGWLTAETRLDNLFPPNPRVLIQGTGKTAQFQTGRMLSVGTNVTGVVSPSARAPRDVHGRSVHKTVKEALEQQGPADISVIYAPARDSAAKKAAFEAIDAGVPAVMVVAENLPFEDAADIRDRAEEREARLIGPNSPGIMLLSKEGDTTKRLQIGNVPSTMFEAGNVSIVARSGTGLFDTAQAIQDNGVGGVRAGICIGGDAIRGVNMVDSLLMLEQDPQTKYIVLIGESGGMQEQVAPKLVQAGIITKPVIAMVGGKHMPANYEYGHAGAFKRIVSDDPRNKKEAMERAGVIVVERPQHIADAIRETEKDGWDLHEGWRDKLWEDAGLESHYRKSHDVLYGLVGPYDLGQALHAEKKATTDFVKQLHHLGVDTFNELLDSSIDRGAFKKAIGQNAIYSADLVRSMREIGFKRTKDVIHRVLAPGIFNTMLEKNVWSAGDILNEVNEIGVHNTQQCLQETISPELFQEMLAKKPWNTTHSLRTINNMRWRNFSRAHNEFADVWGADRFEKAYRTNPWIATKLVRGFYRGNLPAEFRDVFSDPQAADRIDDFLEHDIAGLLDIGKRAYLISQRDRKSFSQVYRQELAAATPRAMSVEAARTRLGEDYERLVDNVYGREDWEQVTQSRSTSAAQALHMAANAGVDDLIEKTLDVKRYLRPESFAKGVRRNPWSMTSFLIEAGEMGGENMRKVTDEVLTREVFDYSLEEHQWGMSQAFRKINVMGAPEFLRVYKGMESLFTPEFQGQFFREAFRKNPRDAIEILQHVDALGIDDFKKLVTGEAAFGPKGHGFLEMAAVRPRNTAHLLKEVTIMGVDKFNEVVASCIGTSLFQDIAVKSPSNATRIARSINFAGAENFQSEAALYAGQRGVSFSSLIDPEDNLTRIHEVMEAATEKRKAAFGGEEGRAIEFRRLLLPAIGHNLSLDNLDRALSGSEAFFPDLQGLRDVKPGKGHAFDAYTHTLETVFALDKLEKDLIGNRLFPEEASAITHHAEWCLKEPIDGVAKKDLLKVAGALHDIGKLKSLDDDHAVIGAETAGQILKNNFSLTDRQIEFVTTLIRHHKPPKLMKRGEDGTVTESFDDFVTRGGIRLLLDELGGKGKNPYLVETAFLYHADILAHRGKGTPPEDVERRKNITRLLLEEDMRRKNSEIKPPYRRGE